MKTLDDLGINVAMKLNYEEHVKVFVQVHSTKYSNGNIFANRKYIFDGDIYSERERACYERDDDTSESNLINDAVGNLQSCFNSQHYNFKVNGNEVEISPKEGVSIAERIISGDRKSVV